MKSKNRRVRRTHRSLHNALMSLILEKNYDSLTVQEILDRADVGRSTFYAHFDGKDELLLSGTDDLRNTLDAALQEERLSTKRHDVAIGFSGAMFEHAHEYRNVYYALLHTQGWPLFRQRLQEILQELIRRECKAEIHKLRKADSEVPVELFVHYLTSAFLSVLTWWLDRRSRLAPKEINDVFRSLISPTINAVLGAW
ncbi:MAG: TetR/AcrR family transcriptional regulator [Acidobacteriia bacterium]|nr:TetR/AcrR family transcriptional regulator [Terriglobia bacterium]